eukprot:1179795-Pyramimonas_sp.AAC.1
MGVVERERDPHLTTCRSEGSWDYNAGRTARRPRAHAETSSPACGHRDRHRHRHRRDEHRR